MGVRGSAPLHPIPSDHAARVGESKKWLNIFVYYLIYSYLCTRNEQ